MAATDEGEFATPLPLDCILVDGDVVIGAQAEPMVLLQMTDRCRQPHQLCEAGGRGKWSGMKRGEPDVRVVSAPRCTEAAMPRVCEPHRVQRGGDGE